VKVGSTLLRIVEDQICWRSKIDKSTGKKLQTNFDDNSTYAGDFLLTLRENQLLQKD
jgi:hypothetical protein